MRFPGTHLHGRQQQNHILVVRVSQLVQCMVHPMFNVTLPLVAVEKGEEKKEINLKKSKIMIII